MFRHLLHVRIAFALCLSACIVTFAAIRALRSPNAPAPQLTPHAHAIPVNRLASQKRAQPTKAKPRFTAPPEAGGVPHGPVPEPEHKSVIDGLEKPLQSAIRHTRLLELRNTKANLQEYQWLDIADMLRELPAATAQIDFVQELTGTRTALFLEYQELVRLHSSLLSNDARKAWNEITTYKPDRSGLQDMGREMTGISVRAIGGSLTVNEVVRLLAQRDALQQRMEAAQRQNDRLDAFVAFMWTQESKFDPRAGDKLPRRMENYVRSMNDLLDAAQRSLPFFLAQKQRRSSITFDQNTVGRQATLPPMPERLVWNIDDIVEQASHPPYPSPTSEVWNPKSSLPRRRAPHTFTTSSNDAGPIRPDVPEILNDIPLVKGYVPAATVILRSKTEQVASRRLFTVNPAGIWAVATEEDIQRVMRGELDPQLPGLAAEGVTLRAWIDQAARLVGEYAEGEQAKGQGLELEVIAILRTNTGKVHGIEIGGSFVREGTQTLSRGPGVPLPAQPSRREQLAAWYADAATALIKSVAESGDLNATAAPGPAPSRQLQRWFDSNSTAGRMVPDIPPGLTPKLVLRAERVPPSVVTISPNDVADCDSMQQWIRDAMMLGADQLQRKDPTLEADLIRVTLTFSREDGTTLSIVGKPDDNDSFTLQRPNAKPIEQNGPVFGYPCTDRSGNVAPLRDQGRLWSYEATNRLIDVVIDDAKTPR